MINDRGSIKWTTMMLPEHAKILRDLWSEDNKVNKPNLDSQEVELLQKKLISAFKENFLVTLTVYRKYEMKQFSGKIIKLDQFNQGVYLKLETKSDLFFPFANIMAVERKK